MRVYELTPWYTFVAVRVAQLDRALPSEGKGCRFEPRHGRFFNGPDRRGPSFFAPLRARERSMTLQEMQQLIRDKYFATDNARGAPGTN